jgi:hypothetical protein
MRHPEGTRFLRRRNARQETLARAMTPQLPEHLRAGRPRYGVPPTPEQQRAFSERQRAIEKFGAKVDDRREDRRSGDRRKMAMSEKEVDDWLRMNGFNGGDRRKAQRRQGDRRR